VSSLILILFAALGAIGFSALIAIAFGRVSARADLASELLLLEAALAGYAGTAGLAAAQEAISREPSITLPSSSTSVGTMRLPVKRSTS
jgi:hypothetical protein